MKIFHSKNSLSWHIVRPTDAQSRAVPQAESGLPGERYGQRYDKACPENVKRRNGRSRSGKATAEPIREALERWEIGSIPRDSSPQNSESMVS